MIRLRIGHSTEQKKKNPLKMRSCALMGYFRIDLYIHLG